MHAVPKKLMPTMGYPGARSKTRCPENEVVAINQIGSPRRIVGGGHDGIELELANRRVNSVDARIAINGERLVIGKPTEDGLRVIGFRLKCIGKVKDVLIEEGHIGTGAGVIEINRRLECPASYRHAKARPENYANLSGKVVVGRFDFHRLRAGFASNGVFFSIVIAEAAIAGAGILLFLRGRWKLQTISLCGRVSSNRINIWQWTPLFLLRSELYWIRAFAPSVARCWHTPAVWIQHSWYGRRIRYSVMTCWLSLQTLPAWRALSLPTRLRLPANTRFRSKSSQPTNSTALNTRAMTLRAAFSVKMNCSP